MRLFCKAGDLPASKCAVGTESFCSASIPFDCNKNHFTKELKQPRNCRYLGAFENSTSGNVKANCEERTWWFRSGAAADDRCMTGNFFP